MSNFLITCDTNNPLCTCTVWDPQTGTNLMTYKGGGVAEMNTVVLIGCDYLAAVEKNKPMLNIWPVNSQQTVQGMRFVLPGRVNAFACSGDGAYCVAGIEEKIYLWSIASGRLLTLISRHYQKVRHLKFSADGKFFVSGAEDGMVMVWSLRMVAVHPEAELITQNRAGQHDPVYIFNDHTSPISGVCISKLGMHGRLCTVSSDRTCKIYDLMSGEMLLNLIFDDSLTSVTMDTLEFNVFVGTKEGKIHTFCLTNPPRNRDLHVDEANNTFISHKNAVNCLSVSIADDVLMSGSDDETVILWHIPSREPIRTIKHKGAITNAFFTTDLQKIHHQDLSPSIILHNLQRTLDKDTEETPTLEILSKSQIQFWPEPSENDVKIAYYNNYPEGGKMKIMDSEDKHIEEAVQLKNINAQLYKYAINVIKSNTNMTTEQIVRKKTNK